VKLSQVPVRAAGFTVWLQIRRSNSILSKTMSYILVEACPKTQSRQLLRRRHDATVPRARQ
jgi:hypothetical protein